MSIQRTDIDYYKSAVINDSGTNGGRLSAVESISGVANNIFPTVSQSERIAGSNKYRKMFVKNSESTGLVLQNAKIFIENPTPGDDHVLMFAGTQTNTQADLTGSERLYGSGWLNVTVSAAATVITVRVEDGTNYKPFFIGDTIRISDKANLDASGNAEILTVSNVTWAGDVATITFSPALQNGYSATSDATRVSSYLDLSDIGANVSVAMVVTSTGGDYDDNTFPLQLRNVSTVEQNWTLTFTSTSVFNINGNTLGLVGTGSIGGGAAPDNPDFAGNPYFTLLSTGFSGSWQIGDTIAFSTSPSAKAVWFRRIVPAGIASISGNNFVIAVEGEST